MAIIHIQLKSTFAGILLLLVICSAGCLETRNPPFRQSDTIKHPSLSGNWIEAKDFSGRPDDNPRRWLYTDNTNILSGRDANGVVQDGQIVFFRLGSVCYASQLMPPTPKLGWTSEFCVTARVTVHGSMIAVWYINTYFVESTLKRTPTLLDHLHIDVRDPATPKFSSRKMQITASTDDLRSFLLSYQALPDFYETYGPQLFKHADNELPITDDDSLFSRKQRTYDYWFATFAHLLKPAQRMRNWFPGSTLTYKQCIEDAARDISSMPTLGVDSSAVSFALESVALMRSGIASNEEATADIVVPLIACFVLAYNGDSENALQSAAQAGDAYVGNAQRKKAQSDAVNRWLNERLPRVRAELTAKYDVQF